MAGVNKVILIGNLGKDPEKRVTGNGQTVCRFSIATSSQWNDTNGQRQERTEWHRIVVWGKQADTCAQYLSKGRPVYVEGRLQTSEWNDKEGHKRYTTEVIAERVQFLGSRDQSTGSSPRDQSHDREPMPGFADDAAAGTTEDVPF
ncbi:MAG: single-stranded DNA-binding protein [Deltaproteobacteria bacterium]|nr:single-stranded DNA-binding protein [Deltaproteobacteria bacterium]